MRVVALRTGSTWLLMLLSRGLPLAVVTVAVAVVAVLFLAGCRSQPSQQALEQALTPFIDEHAEEVDGDVEWVAGEAQTPETLHRAGIFLVEERDELVRIWANQGEGPMPEVDFNREVILAVFLTRSAATSLRFHSLRYNEEERVYEAYVLGVLEPLTQIRYNHPYLLATLPVRAGSIRVHRIHVRELPEGGWEIQPFGTPDTLTRRR